HFGENQLSRSLISLSPLPTPHPPGFQPWWVRASTRTYPRFTLDMRRSLRFGSTACDSPRPVQTRFPYGYPTPVYPCHTPRPAGSFRKRHAITTPKKGRSDGLTAHAFRYSFTTPHRGTFHLSLTVLVHYRSPGRILA